MSQLVIRLPAPSGAHAAPAAWGFVLSHNGQDVARHGTAEAALLPFGHVDDIVALVPHQALSWHQVDMPKGSMAGAQRLRTVLDGLLEDRLLSDVGEMHFALAPGATAPGTVWVAACNAAWLRDCLDTLERAGCTVGRIVPEFHPPLATGGDGADNTPSLYAVGDSMDTACWVRIHANPPASLPANQSAAHTPPASAAGVISWPLLPQEHTALWGSQTAPQHMGGHTVQAAHIQADPAVAHAAEHWLQQPVRVVPVAQRCLQAAQSPWNLAQGRFANSGRDRLRKRGGQLWHRFAHAAHWRAVRWGVIGLVLVQVLGLNVRAWQTRQHLAQQRQEMQRILHDTFAEIKVLVDAPVQMQRHLALLQQDSGVLAAADLEALLSAVARSAPFARLHGVQWDGSHMRLQGLALSPEEQQSLQASLSAHGLWLQQDGSDWNITTGHASGTPQPPSGKE